MMVVCNEWNISYEEPLFLFSRHIQNTREERRDMFYLISVAWMLSIFFCKVFCLAF